MLKKRARMTRLLMAMQLLMAGGIVAAQPTIAASTTTTTTTAAPTVTTVGPTTAVAGGTAFTLTVNGTGFINGSQVYLDRTPLATTFLSATQLSAAVTAAAISYPRTAGIFVYNGRRSGGSSNVIPFAVTPSVPAPTVTTINPTSIVSGSPAATLTITGTNFVSGTSQVYFGRTGLTPLTVTPTQTTVSIPATALANPGQVPVIVSNGISSGYSKPTPFTITPANAPTVTSIAPTTVVAGSPAFTLTVNGTGFISSSQVYLNDRFLPTTFVSATQLTASVSAAAIARPGTAGVLVYNGRRNGGASNGVQLPITPSAPPPTVTNLSATSALAGSPATPLTITGTGFVTGAVVYFGRLTLTPTSITPTAITVTIPAAALAYPGQLQVAVSNGVSSGYSTPVTFTVTPPTTQVAYLTGRFGSTTNAALYLTYQVSATAPLDLTQPVTVGVTNPAAVYQSGPITLTPTTLNQRNGTTTTVYEFESSTVAIIVVPQANNQYSVEFETIGLDLSQVNTTLPVTVTLNIGGQTFTAQTQPYAGRG